MATHRQPVTVAEICFTRSSEAPRNLVEQAERLAFSELDGTIRIFELCRVLSVSERTVRKAFRKIHGVPPCRHLRMLRLSQARQALLSADSQHATVTEIATCFGFVELGRFSVEYRKLFGEKPSDTLNRAPAHHDTYVERWQDRTSSNSHASRCEH